MKAADVMVSNVITVGVGAPVVDEKGGLVGIVSEGDLMHRAELGTERRHHRRRRSWWLEMLAAEREEAAATTSNRTVVRLRT